MQSEITVEVLCSKKELFAILERRGFFLKESLSMVDHYYTPLQLIRTADFKELISHSMLVRNVKLERRYFSSNGITTLMYKKKQIDEHNRTISEEKTTCDLDNMAKAKKIFTAIGLKNWCTKKMNGHVFKKGNIELLIQDVEELGIFIELEQQEHQRGTSARIISNLIKFIKNLGIPMGDDFHVSIAYRLYLRNNLPPKATSVQSVAKKKKPAKVAAKKTVKKATSAPPREEEPDIPADIIKVVFK